MSTKYYYYVLVFTSEGAKYVTSIDRCNKYCKWDKLEKPLLFTSRESANDIVLGLNCNMFNAVVVTSKWEIETQPYNYNLGKFEWAYNDK